MEPTLSNLSALKVMVKNNAFDEAKFYEILNLFENKTPVVPLVIKRGQRIFRSTFNKGTNFPATIMDVAYPPKELAKADKATVAGKPMFYGSLFSSSPSDDINPLVSNILETPDIAREYKIKGVVNATQTIWVVNRDLELFAFPFSEDSALACQELMLVHNIWDKVKVFFNEEQIAISEYIGDLMAHTNHSCINEITGKAVDWVLNHRDTEKTLHGVLYPSPYAEGAYMDICLHPDDARNNLLYAGSTAVEITNYMNEPIVNVLARAEANEDSGLEWTFETTKE